MTEDEVLARAEPLARQCAGAGVSGEQLGLVLAHLKRHCQVEGTLALLAELRASPFARRSGQTPRQFQALEQGVKLALSKVASWEDAAGIVGWARRLVVFYQPSGGRRLEPGKRRNPA